MFLVGLFKEICKKGVCEDPRVHPVNDCLDCFGATEPVEESKGRR
jgi:hypothetical protein